MKARYQIVPSKAVVTVGSEQPMYELSKNNYKPYTKSHLELQKEITLIQWAPSPYFFQSICLVDMNMFARFDEIPAMTL